MGMSEGKKDSDVSSLLINLTNASEENISHNKTLF